MTFQIFRDFPILVQNEHKTLEHRKFSIQEYRQLLVWLLTVIIECGRNIPTGHEH